jgi:3-dehydroquinate dehydratase-2
LKVLVIHGPNLNLLGRREPELYGEKTLDKVDKEIRALGKDLGFDVKCVQLNGEGEIVSRIQKGDYDVLIINPGAYTHTSIAIRDAIAAVGKSTIEVHISNIHKREEYRRRSFVAEVSEGQISGFGTDSYLLALRAASGLISSI